MHARPTLFTLVMALTTSSVALAQPSGTFNGGTSAANLAYFFGRVCYTNDRFHGTLPCGVGPQASSTPYSFGSASSLLGIGHVSVSADGTRPGGGTR